MTITTTATTMTTTAAATTTTPTTATTRVSRAMRRLQRSSVARRAAIANAAAVPIATNAKRSVPELVDFFGGGKIHRRRPSTSSLSSGASTSDSEWDEDEDEEFEDDGGCNADDEEEASANKEDPSNAQEESVAAAGHGWAGVAATPTMAASISIVATPTAAHVVVSRTGERGSYSQLSQSQSQNTPPTAAPAADLQYHQEQKQRAHTQTRSTLECSTPSPTLPTGTSAIAPAVIEVLWLFVNALVLVMTWLVASFTTTTKANDSSIVATPRTQLAAFSTKSTGTATTDAKRSAACYTGNSGVSANRKIVSIVNSDDVATPAAKCTDSAQDQASSCTNVYNSLSAAANSTAGCVASVSAAAVTTTTAFTDPVSRSQCKDSIGDDKQDHLHAACEAEVISQAQIDGDEQDKTNVAQDAEDGVKDRVHERSDDEADQDQDKTQDQDQDQIPNQDLDQDEDQVKDYDEDQDEDETRADVHQSAQTAAVAPSPVDHVQAEAAEDYAEEDIQIRIQASQYSESHLPEAENGDLATPTRASSEKSKSDIAAEPSDTVSTATQQQRPPRKSVRAVYMEYPSTERYQRHLLSTLGMRERVENLTPANLQQQQVLRHQQQQWRW